MKHFYKKRSLFGIYTKFLQKLCFNIVNYRIKKVLGLVVIIILAYSIDVHSQSFEYDGALQNANETTLDVGSYSAPVFADIDGDNDPDMFVGNSDGYIKVFINDGSFNYSDAGGSLEDNNGNFIDIGNNASPIFADLDGDNDLDLYIGESAGRIRVFLNDGNGIFTSAGYLYADGNIIDIGSRSAPAFADIDGDNDLDLYVGEQYGTIYFYKNNGSGVFTEQGQLEGNGSLVRSINYSTPAFADNDGDGDLDLFIGQSSGEIVVYTNSNGTFINGATLSNIDAGSYSSPAFTDYNGDGNLDLFVGNSDGYVKLYVNQGIANFTIQKNITAAHQDYSNLIIPDAYNACDFIDIDGDNDLDMFAGSNNGYVRIFTNTGNGSFVFKENLLNTDFGTWARPTFADIDGDNDLDLYIGESGGRIYVCENNGGTFTLSLNSANLHTNGSGFLIDNGATQIDVYDYSAPTFADLDNDGDLDLFIGNQLGNIRVYENNGGIFTVSVNSAVFNTEGSGYLKQSNGSTLDVTSRATPLFADIDGDGDLDLYVGRQNYYIQVYLNNGSNSFTYNDYLRDNSGNVIYTYYGSPRFTDIDGDGDLDFFTGHWDNYIRQYYNNGSGTFFSNGYLKDGSDMNIYVGNRASSTYADVDNDGDLDLYIGESSGFIKFYENDGSNSFVYKGKLLDVDFGSYATPAFADINNDGDLDLYIGESGGRIWVCENNGGTFTLSINSAVYHTNSSGYLTYNGSSQLDAGSYSSPEFIDLDNDGDLDLYIGESGGGIRVYENNGGAFTQSINSASLQTNSSGYLKYNGSSQLDVGSYSSPDFFDMDNDGDLDLYVGENNGRIRVYTNNNNTFTLGSAETDGSGYLLSGTTQFDIGGYSVPEFADLDGDGNKEFYVSNSDGYIKEILSGTALYNYNSNLTAIQDINPYRNTPAFADLDNDGDLDLYVGESGGRIEVYENNGGTYTKSINSATLHTNSNGYLTYNGTNQLDVGSYATPKFVDFDNDDDLDLYVGNSNGQIMVFENNGNAFTKCYNSTTLFTEGGAYIAYNGGSRLDVGSYATPEFIDIDADGDFDLYVGESGGRIRVFENNGVEFIQSNNSAILHTNGSGFLTYNGASQLDVGSYASPEFIDFDNDGDFDLYVGESGGRIRVHENNGGAFTLYQNSNSTDGSGYLKKQNGYQIDVGSYSSPVYFEENNNYYLVIGSQNSGIQRYKINFTPVFNENMATTISVNENSPAGTVLLNANASDRNGDALTYSVTSANVAISNSGEVTIANATYFDYEVNTNLIFDVTVSDGELEDTETITLNINNINDNAPVFTLVDITNDHFDEDTPSGTELIFEMTASDADGDAFTFSSPFRGVNVNPTTGRVTIADPNYFNADNGTTKTFDVLVSDGDLTDSETITVTVNNINEAPILSKTNFSIDENSPVGTVIGVTIPFDDDGDAVTVSSNATEVNFDANGQITIANAAYFDAELNSFANFNVTLSDGKLTNTETVVIRIKNINDNAPVLNAVSGLSVVENSPVGTAIGKITATDADDDQLTFSTTSTQVAVNAQTGMLTVADPSAFDSETNATISVTIAVNDGKTEVTKDYTITVVNTNDAPVLSENSFSINENSAAGTVIGTLTATDGDDNPVSFSSTSSIVSVSTDGVVSIANAAYFDAELRTSASFYVTLSDGSVNVYEKVTVAINNINDNIPAFETIPILTVDENSPVGTLIGTIIAVDADGDNISFSTSSDIVAINANGELTVNSLSAFDFETAATVTFDISISDGSSKSIVTESVNVDVNNVNDNSPVFGSATLAVEENSPYGTEIGKLSATDADGDILSFSTTSSIVLVNANTGVIKVIDRTAFDAETTPSLTFTAKVSDGLNESSEEFTISVSNINDNAPVISNHNFTVDENSTEGTEIGTINATDADGNSITFSATSNIVAVSSNGIISIKDASYFDAEINSEFEINVNVTDGTNSSSEVILISINNLNDNPPVFDDISSELSVNENSAAGTQLLELTATDADNDEITFSTTSSHVAIDADGIITIVDATYLDYETNTSLVFDVTASDGTKTDTRTITVKINNLNDNAPVINAVTSANVDENSPAGTAIFTLTGADADGNTPMFKTNDSRVSVNAGTGLVSVFDVAAFNAEENSSLTIEFIAYDGVFEDSKAVTININDINESPVFGSSPALISINENSASGTELVALNLSDDDGDALTVTTNNENVSVDASGIVTISNPDYFDAEEISNISITVTAADADFEISKSFNVKINNVNDVAPVIAPVSNLSIDENKPVGTRIITLSATDGDVGSSTLTFSTNSNAVSVGTYSGAVTIANASAFNAESSSTVSFDITVSDGQLTSTETISVSVIDINDAPVFGSISTGLSIDENVPVGTEILTVTVSDDDNDPITLSCSSSNVAIDSTGKVTIANANYFDAEQNQTVSFTVKASDGFSSSTKTITVNINNLNDNIPIFASVSSGLNVVENSAAGTELLKLTATDADGDAITYSTTSANVTVDASTGLVTIADESAFDAEINKNLSFDIKASDGTNEVSKTVVIAITNINDNAPVFASEYNITTTNYHANGYVIKTIMADDADGDRLVYSLEDGFTIFTLSEGGDLILKHGENLDTTQTSISFALKVTADDGKFTAETTVNLTIDITNGIVNITAEDIKMYPNPAADILTFELPELKEKFTVQLYNSKGAVIQEDILVSEITTIDISELPQGVYIVKIRSNNDAIIKRLVIE